MLSPQCWGGIFMIIATMAVFAFVFTQCENLWASHVLWYGVSSQYWGKKSCRWWRREHLFTILMISGGIQSFLVLFLKLGVYCFVDFIDGRQKVKFILDRQGCSILEGCVGDDFSWVKLLIVLGSSLHLPSAICDYITWDGLERTIFMCLGSTFFYALYIAWLLPQFTEVWMSQHSFNHKALAHLWAVLLAQLWDDSYAASVVLEGCLLYSRRKARLAVMAGSKSSIIASNQTSLFLSFFLKMSEAALYITLWMKSQRGVSLVVGLSLRALFIA